MNRMSGKKSLERIRRGAAVVEMAVITPFVFAMLGPVPIVPLLVGLAPSEYVAEVLARLWDEDTLAIVSTELSHYLAYEQARHRDAATANAIENLDDSRIGIRDAC